jgi:hypothetical protein
VSVTEPDAPLAVALIVVVPVPINVAVPVAELMVATPVLEEFQVGDTIWLELFVAMNVTEPEANEAVNAAVLCCVQPEQVIVKPPVFEVPTVSVVVPLTLLLVAVIIVVLPFAAEAATVARPEVLMLATLLEEEVQVTDERALVPPLAVVPVAANCCVCPA